MAKTLPPRTLLQDEIDVFSRQAPEGLVIAEVRGRTIIKLDWQGQDKTEKLDKAMGGLLPTVGQSTADSGKGALRYAPFSVLLVSAELTARDLVAERQKSLSDLGVTWVDLSHGYVVLRLSGERAREVLDSMASTDLSAGRFNPGAVARTSIRKHQVLVHSLNSSCLEVYLERSYALSFWHLLEHKIALG
ncbi:MAG: sarcosine oxidase subunit gamma family protein [Pseudomonadota bacterium]